MLKKYLKRFILITFCFSFLGLKSQELKRLNKIEFYKALSGLDERFIKTGVINTYDEFGDIVSSKLDTTIVFEYVIIQSDKADSVLQDRYNHLGELISPRISPDKLMNQLKGKKLKRDSNNKLIVPYNINISNSMLIGIELQNMNISKFSLKNVFSNFNIHNCSFFEFYSHTYSGKEWLVNKWNKYKIGPASSYVNITGSIFQKLTINLPFVTEIKIDSSTIDVFKYDSNPKYSLNETSINISNSILKNQFAAFVNITSREYDENIYDYLRPEEQAGKIILKISNSEFKHIGKKDNYSSYIAKQWVIGGTGNIDVLLENCNMKSTSSFSNLVFLGDFRSIEIHNSQIENPIVLNDAEIKHRFSILDSKCKSLSLYKTSVPEEVYNINLNWGQFEDKFPLHLVDFNTSIDNNKFNDDSTSFLRLFNGEISQINNLNYYSDLIAVYSNAYKIYKDRGEKESANPCYAYYKVIETRRWKYLYIQNKSFESFFRWQLNSFLSYFTDYGTNPAKAVIKSGWVILLFSIFYLFFPSDWDVSNRSQLLSKIKDLATKNRDKSFLATLGFVSYSAFIQILNALTLSLNAFTTLGFGDIPTHGAARYVTIVQGFIGWFLLTIFSVSLINQVLG